MVSSRIGSLGSIFAPKRDLALEMIALFLLVQMILGRTQLRSQDSATIESDRSKYYVASRLQALDPSARVTRARRQVEADAGFKFRPAPLRTRTSSLGRRPIGPIESSRTSSKHAREKPMNSTVNFNHLKSKRHKQMAPAYELWPEDIGERPKYRVDRGSIRNLLPRPVRLVGSDSQARALTVRSTQPESEDDGEEESEEEENNAESEPEMRDQINLEVFDGSQAKTESRSWPESPIYPPGDLDRLYSDALLVYVKDFNQYITR